MLTIQLPLTPFSLVAVCRSLTAAELLGALAEPEAFELKKGVWYALRSFGGDADASREASLSARFGLSQEDFERLLDEAGINSLTARSNVYQDRIKALTGKQGVIFRRRDHIPTFGQKIPCASIDRTVL